ncbi:MAG: ATP synthase F0 subunit B [Oscillospiraceae bacterium]|nr:ATP synthase F0 subunit B [Oscillospiraceae bacterium]
MDRLFALDAQTLVQIAIQLLNACVLAVVLTYLLYKPVRKFLAKRTEGIQAQLTRAQGDRAAAEELKALYERKLEALEGERAALLEEARVLAEERRRQLEAVTAQDIAAMRARAEADIAAQRERAREDNRVKIIETATALAGNFAAAALDDAARDRLFEETLRALEGAS